MPGKHVTRKQRIDLAQKVLDAPEKATNAEVRALAIEVLRVNLGRQFDPAKYGLTDQKFPASR